MGIEMQVLEVAGPASVSWSVQGLVIMGREPTASALSSLETHEMDQKGDKSFHCFFFNDTLKRTFKSRIFHNYFILFLEYE